ncbi:hypothetical protein RDABS01_024305 [Bienertia sinuspersici]
MVGAAQLLGFEDFIPPFSTAQGKQILKGVNYASGASGIRSETGQHLVVFFVTATYIIIP